MASNNIGSMFLLVIIVMGASPSLSSGTAGSQCSSSVKSVASCLEYVTGTVPMVPSQCCTATAKLYSTNEVCLCYFVEQAYTNGSAQGGGPIDMQKLLGLPSVCNIKTANATKCIALLGLTPSSPGAAVFLSPPSSSSTPSSPTTTTSPPPPAKSAAFVHQALSMDKLTLLAVAVLLCIFPVGFMAQTM
ncbi:Non-specific lipid transfer protein GPI-anchored 1-like protein [Drosera capensis]